MCKQCQKNPVYEFTNKRRLCKKCFIKYFQKKALYTLRKFKMIKKGDVIFCENKKDFRNVVLKDVLELIVDKIPVKLIKNKVKGCKIAIPSTIDSEAEKIVSEIIRGDIKKLKYAVEGKIIKPLYLFLDEEVLLYARLRKLDKYLRKLKKDEISFFLDNLEKEHPEIKRAIVNSYLRLHDKIKSECKID